jgi:hypothetical protein
MSKVALAVFLSHLDAVLLGREADSLFKLAPLRFSGQGQKQDPPSNGRGWGTRSIHELLPGPSLEPL